MASASERGAFVSASDELERSSLTMLDDLSRLTEMERCKHYMSPDDPARPQLARDIEELATIVLGRSSYQRRLADEGLREHGAASEPKSAARVLEEWRDAERRLMVLRASLGCAIEETERLRDEYRAVFEREATRGDATA